MKPRPGEAPYEAIANESLDDQASFERIYRDHFEAIYAYVIRRAGRADTADLVADVFATAWRRNTDLPEPPEDKLWLFGVARRVVSQHNRSKSRRERLILKLGRTIVRVVHASPDTSDLEERVLRLIDGLRPDDRELVTLIVWDGLTHAEVATVLGCSTNAVAIRWHRALKRLRRDIAGVTDHRIRSTLAATQPLHEET